jgi:hypothetical protein
LTDATLASSYELARIADALEDIAIIFGGAPGRSSEPAPVKSQSLPLFVDVPLPLDPDNDTGD